MKWFDNWYGEVKESSSKGTSGLKEHWKKFIPRITYKDLKRTTRAFLGVVQYVQINHPELHIIPKTMCQDDVENYKRFLRSFAPHAEKCVARYFGVLCVLGFFCAVRC